MLETIQEVCAEHGEDFQEYKFKDGSIVPHETLVGFEVQNPRTKEWELHLLDDVFFSDTCQQ
jgi:hypothetical protein